MRRVLLLVVWLLVSSGAASWAQGLTRVSVASDGTQGAGMSDYPSFSADGRYVAFESASLNFVAEDMNSALDVFVRDRDTDEDGIFDEPGQVATIRVSLGSLDSPGDDDSYHANISRNGRFVTFHSDARNLVSGDTNMRRDIFLRDRDHDDDGIFDEPGSVATSRESLSQPGTQANRASSDPVVSDNGRIAFFSGADNLVPGDDNESGDIFHSDRDADSDWIIGGRVITRITEANSGALKSSFHPGISRDGRYVVFGSDNTGLVDLDTNGFTDVFLHDRDVDGDGVYYEMDDTKTIRVSVPQAGGQATGDSDFPSITGDGRFVVYASTAPNLVATTITATSVFVRDRDTDQNGIYEEAGGVSTVLVSVSSSGVPGNGDSFGASISENGRFVAFSSGADNLVSDDTNEFFDVFVHDRDEDEDGVFDEPGAIATARVSLSPSGAQGIGHSSGRTAFSADGRYVAFPSDARFLVPDDSNFVQDIYVANNPFFADSDGDGVPEMEEMGPNGDDPDFDGNGDGLADALQDDVGSLHTFDQTGYVTVAALDGSLRSLSSAPNPSPSDAPPNVSFPLGFFDFRIEGLPFGGAATVEIHSDGPVQIDSYDKFGPTPGDATTPGNPTPHWYPFAYDGETGAEIVGDVVVLHLVDGKRGDWDLVENGVIIDPGAPSLVPEPQPMLLGTVALLCLGGLLHAHRLHAHERKEDRAS